MSTVAPAPTLNGTPAVPTASNASSPANAAGGRTQLKMTSNGKALDGPRKQAGSPMDGSQRKFSSQKTAWSQGSNPITQRSTTQNGTLPTAKSSPAPKGPGVPAKETNTPDRHANDRLMFLLANFRGLMAHVTLKNGERFAGIFSGASLEPSDSRYILKMARRIDPHPAQQSNGVVDSGDEYAGTGEDHVMVFEVQDVVDLEVANVVTDKANTKPSNGASTGFRTDTDISGNLAMRERNLKRWEPSTDSSVDLSLDESGKVGWDQFEANERLYGLKSDYDENLYTTTIDRNHPLYKQRAEAAEKKAREIEASTAMNAHVAEERNHSAADDGVMDEEQKYSGVRRDYQPLQSGQTNKYTPPARRPPTGQPTVHGAPVDPAIISSQIARPDSASSAKASQSKESAPASAQEQNSTKADVQPKADEAMAEVVVPSSSQAPSAAPPPAEVKQKPSVPPLKTTAATNPASGAGKVGRADNATANVELELLDSFKQFSAQEKLRMAERQRTKAHADKAVKLNDLKKFSETFKLHTPVPTDLVPILAKDKIKQEAIVEKAMRNIQEVKATAPKAPSSASADQKVSRPAAGQPGSATTVDRNLQRSRPPQQNAYGGSGRSDRPAQNQHVNPLSPRNGPGHLGQRLALAQQQHKAATALPNVYPVPMSEMRITPTGPSAVPSGVPTPTSSVSSKFNVRAMEFKPNPAASSFSPVPEPATGPSPKNDSSSRSTPRRPASSSFFGGKKLVPRSERPPIHEAFNPIKRMKKEAEAENKAKEYFYNGGIPQAYRTPPTWDVPEANREKSYLDMFERAMPVPSISPPHASMPNPPMAHQHQLPLHLQHGAPNLVQTQTPHQTPRHMPAQPHHGPTGPHHFDEQHRMQFTSSNSSAHPSPRMMPPFIAYNHQIPQPMPLYHTMPAYGMSPGAPAVAVRHMPAGAQFAAPPGPAFGGHMMTHQASSGPYMGVPINPQMQVYSPNPTHAFPHHGGPPPSGPNGNGYPSPRPAPMMSHQGSQHGHPPQQVFYMQPGGQAPPIFAQTPSGPMTPMRGPFPQPHQPHHYGSPHQPHHFPPQQHRGTPSGSFTQPMMPTHSLPPQVPQHVGHPSHVEAGEEVK